MNGMGVYYGTGAAKGVGSSLEDTRQCPSCLIVSDGHLQLPEDGTICLSKRGENNEDVLIHCALILDLGNSRTAGVIIDDYDHDQSAAHREMHIIPLKPLDYVGMHSPSEGSGVMDSVLAVECFQGFSPLSCLRVGDLARTLEKRVRSQIPGGKRVRATFCAPKLTFWSDEKVEGLHAINRSQGGGEAVTLGEPSDEQKKRLERENDLIGEMVLELLEQAETQINRWAAEKQGDLSVAQGPRRIGHIAISYPASWTPAERDRYIAVIQKKIDEEWCAPLGLKGVEASWSVDEATAVLLAYATNQVDALAQQEAVWRNNAEKIRDWLDGIGGKQEPGGLDIWSTDIGIIDIGGGTTDMAVVSMGVLCKGNPHLWVEILRTGGMCVAGNEYLKHVAERIVIPLFRDALAKKIFNKKDIIIGKLRRDGNLLKKYCKYCFYGMALAVAMQDGKKLHECVKELVSNHLRNDFKNSEQKEEISVDEDDFADEIVRNGITDKIKRQLESIALDTFKETVIHPFTESLKGRWPAKVLLAGKPFEIPSVKKVFQEEFPSEIQNRLQFMGEYELAGYWKNLYRGEFDVKQMTVIGGATAFLVRQRASSMPVWKGGVELLDRRKGGGYIWKFEYAGEQELTIGQPVEHRFEDNKGERLLKFSRDMPEMRPQIGYVAVFRGESGDSAKLLLTQEGKIEPATPADAEKLHLIMKVDSGESNWMETGDLDLDQNFPKLEETAGGAGLKSTDTPLSRGGITVEYRTEVLPPPDEGLGEIWGSSDEDILLVSNGLPSLAQTEKDVPDRRDDTGTIRDDLHSTLHPGPTVGNEEKVESQVSPDVAKHKIQQSSNPNIGKKTASPAKRKVGKVLKGTRAQKSEASDDGKTSK